MRITKDKVKPVIIINDTTEHGYPHCHVGQKRDKVYVFSDGIVPEKKLTKKDLKFIYDYYDDMVKHFNSINWDVVPCPAEYINDLYSG